MTGKEWVENNAYRFTKRDSYPDIAVDAFEAGKAEGIALSTALQPKPNRRAELLELTSRLSAAALSCFGVKMKDVRDWAPSLVATAKAIIEEVDVHCKK